MAQQRRRRQGQEHSRSQSRQSEYERGFDDDRSRNEWNETDEQRFQPGRRPQGRYGYGQEETDREQSRYRQSYGGEFGPPGYGPQRYGPPGEWERGGFGEERGEADWRQRGFQGPGGYGWSYDPYGGQAGRFGESSRGFGQDPGSDERGRAGSGGFAGKGPKGYRRSDERIIEDVCQALEDDDEVDARNIEVTCQSNEIVLRGSVPDRRMKRLAEDVAEGLPGVKDVRNELRVAGEGEAKEAKGTQAKERHGSGS